jgi:two-component sensor histidine kinase
METPEPEPAAQDNAAQDNSADGHGAAPPQPPILQPAFFRHPELIPVALDTAQIGIWSWDIASQQPTWSSNVADIHGTDPSTVFTGVLADLESLVDPEDRAGIASAIQETLRTHKPSRVRYRLVARPGADERWIETVATVVLKDGAPAQLLGSCWEVTEGARAHRELRVRASQQEAVARLADRALVESDLQKFFDAAAAAIAEILDVELVKILELVPGDAELVLRAGVGWKPGYVGAAYVATSRDTQAGFTLASGGPVIMESLQQETRFTGAPLLREHNVVSGVSIPIAGRDGRAYGVLTAHTTRHRKFNESDVSFLTAAANVIASATQRLQLDRRQELMIRELRHRSGNLFSQLLALFAQTAKSSNTVADLVTKYEARVLALANAHRLITEGGWESAALTKILNTVLTPYLDRIAFAGPNVLLEPDAAFGVSMAAHELATNASKYGSLSTRPGRVEVTWTVDRGERGITLALDWKEFDGPPPKRNPKPGFGMRLINMVITRQLNGEVQQQFGAEGLNARLIVPITRERWPGTRAAEVQIPT